MDEPSGGPLSPARPRWLARNLKWLISTLAIPAVLGFVAHEFTEMEAQRARDDTDAQAQRARADREAADSRTLTDGRLKAYSDLLNKREGAEMNVRSQIFSTLLGNYFDPKKGDLPRRLTVLELLATNFDESLDLSPLFWELDRDLEGQPEPSKGALRDQLRRVASNVKLHQIDTLSASGAETRWDVRVSGKLVDVLLEDRSVQFTDPASPGAVVRGCIFRVRLIDHDPVHHRLNAIVQTDAIDVSKSSSCVTLDPESHVAQPRTWSFWVDEYDFPLITYTRLSTDERFALVMVEYKPAEGYANLSLVFFPSSRGGARDRPYLDTVFNSLNVAIPRLSAASGPAESKR
jgi:hypothetical protein